MKALTKIFIFCFVLMALDVCARADLYQASRATARITAGDGIGSGICVGSDGTYYYLVTNAHVATTGTVTVEFFDAGRITRVGGECIRRNAEIDLAVIRVNCMGKYNPAIIPIDPSYTMKEGDILCSIGHPLGKMPTAFFCTFKERNTAFGIIFEPRPAQGRSGSPLLAPDGSRVVGIVYGMFKEESGGLAIPADVVLRFLTSSMEGRTAPTRWKPQTDSKIVLFTAHSILENPDETGLEETGIAVNEIPAANESETERVEESAPVFEVEPARLRIFQRFRPLRERPIFQKMRPVFPRPSLEGARNYDSEIDVTGLKLKIGNTEFELKEKEKEQATPPETPAPEPRPAPVKPRREPPPFPHALPVPPPRYYAPPPPPMPRHRAETGSESGVVFAQYRTCPGGNCPTIPMTPTVPPAGSGIPSTGSPIPVEVAGNPPADTLKRALPAPAGKSDDDSLFPRLKALTETADAYGRIAELEKRVAQLEESVNELKKPPSVSESGLLRKSIPDGVESGLRDGIEKGAGVVVDAVRLECGDKVERIAKSLDDVKNSTCDSLEGATASFRDACDGLKENTRIFTRAASVSMITASVLITLCSVIGCFFYVKGKINEELD